MIYGIGTDIVSVKRMADALARHGDRFAQRILAQGELAAYQGATHKGRFLAKRFAAKEAAAKAFGTGFSRGLSLHDISVSHDEAGRPLLNLAGRAEELAASLGIGDAHLSISDEHDYAIAFVTLMKK